MTGKRCPTVCDRQGADGFADLKTAWPKVRGARVCLGLRKTIFLPPLQAGFARNTTQAEAWASMFSSLCGGVGSLGS